MPGGRDRLRGVAALLFVLVGGLALPSTAQRSPPNRAAQALGAAEAAIERGQRPRALIRLRRAQQLAGGDILPFVRAAEYLAERLGAFSSLTPAERRLLRHTARGLEGSRGDGVRVSEGRLISARALVRAMGGDLGGAIEGLVRSAGPHNRSAARALSTMATEAVRRRDLHLAHRALVGATRTLPEEPMHWADLGAVALQRGRATDAVRYFGRASTRAPDDIGLRRDLAAAMLADGRAAEAVTLLAELSNRNPTALELHVDLAAAALEAGQPRVAESVARRLLSRLAPDDGRAHSLLGAALMTRREDVAAERALREAIRRNPQDLRASEALRIISERRSSNKRIKFAPNLAGTAAQR